jgi:diacylglycerol O-acyltransferase
MDREDIREDPGGTPAGVLPRGALEPLDREDARILALESPTIAGHTCKVLVVESPAGGPPGLEAVRGRLRERLDRVPRLRQRVAFGKDGAGPAWMEDLDFSVDRHVRPAPSPELTLPELTVAAMSGRLDRSRPLWDMVVDSPAGGDWALIWRVHHCLADGMTAIRWASELLRDEPSSDPPVSARSEPAARRDRRSRRAGVLARTPATLIRELRRVDPPSPFSGTIGLERRVAFVHRPLDELKRIAHEHGATVNDVLLAAVAGGIRRWLEAVHDPITAMRAKVPVSLHPHGTEPDSLGNRDSFFFVDLPLAEPDSRRRLLAITRETRRRKNHHDAQVLYAVLDGLARRAPRLGRALTGLTMSPREFSLNVSNVPGPRGTFRMLGGRVREMYSIAEVAERHALRVAAISLSETMFVSLCADSAMVAELTVMADGVDRSIDELVLSPAPS